MKNNTGKNRKHSARTGALIALAAVLLMGSAVAVTVSNGDFYSGFFGTTAVAGETIVQAHEESYMDDQKGEISYTMPGYELVQVDEEQAETLLGDYMQASGESVEAGGYTVTLESYVKDENGVLLVCYSVENPNGLDGLSFYEYNGYTCVSYPGDDGFAVTSSAKQEFVNEQLSTDTKIYVCFACVDIGTAHAGVDSVGCIWLRVYDDYTPEGGADPVKEFSLSAETMLPVITAEAGGLSVHVSPIGLLVEGSSTSQEMTFEIQSGERTGETYTQMVKIGFSVQELAIAMLDGSEYVVYSEGVDNTHYIVQGGDVAEDETFCFNRLIDPEEIASVTVDGTTIAF